MEGIFKNRLIGKIAYGLLFVLVIPTGLYYWSIYLDTILPYEFVELPKFGMIITSFGFIYLVWSMIYLMIQGNGLPMNAYPPKNYVKTGPYALMKHPIYVSFLLMILGYAFFSGSGAIFWVILPICSLSLMALVLGFEKIDLSNRFPGEFQKNSEQDKLKNQQNSGSFEPMSNLIFGLTITVFGHFVMNFIRQVDNTTIIELPDLISQDIIGIIIVGICFAAILYLSKNKTIGKQWTTSLQIGMFIMVVFLGITSQNSVDTLLHQKVSIPLYIMEVEILVCHGIFILLLSSIYLYRTKKNAGKLVSVCMLILFFMILNRIKYPVEISIFVAITLFVSVHYKLIWIIFKHRSEKIANSWQEWRMGKIRIINHGIYVGIGTFVGIMIAGHLAGARQTWPILLYSVILIVFSALWAQVIEGSDKLKRPYGYYGALVGSIFASLIIWLFGYDLWMIIGVGAVSMPWVQAIGRFRCLINGCCHGAETQNEVLGIRYFHYRSRVCGISKMKGVLVHPTPLYSILSLIVIGFVLIALWIKGSPNSYLFGMYLILTSIGRFIEEAYRGEVQTPIIRKLRLYQWTALLALFIGVLITIIPSSLSHYANNFDWQILIPATIGGFFTFFAMGVDFPESNARFARLV